MASPQFDIEKYKELPPDMLRALEEDFNTKNLENRMQLSKPESSDDREIVTVSFAVLAKIREGIKDLNSMMPENWDNEDFQETEDTLIVKELLGALVVTLRDDHDLFSKCKRAFNDGFSPDLLRSLKQEIEKHTAKVIFEEEKGWNYGGGKILSALCIIAGIFIITTCPIAFVAGLAISFVTQSGEPVKFADAWCKMVGFIDRNLNMIKNQSTDGGSVTEYVTILGKRRKVVREGRYKMITYQGQKMCLTDARKLEKQMK